MDNRITGKRLSNVLSYDWFKIIIIIAAVALVWSLAFTMGAPRATTGQTFGFFVYSDFQCAKRESDVLQDAKNKGAFSYDVLDFNTRSLTKDYYATVMTASTSVQEGDVFIMSDVGQRGSNITVERLRFDFNFERPMTEEEIKEVERLVNEAIKADVPVVMEEMTVDQAKAAGAIGLFESKYGDRVKVYTMGNFSKEICGGPHAKRTGELGHFKIIKEQSSSAGIRRIKAVLEY